MPPNGTTLDGGRELAHLYNQDPLVGSLLDRVISAVNQLSQSAAASAVGEIAAPPPVDSINVKAAGEMVHVSLQHSAQVQRNIRYFVEADTSPAFPRPLVSDLGSSRTSHPISLPSLDDSGNQHSWYFRAYAQYPGSQPTQPTVLGGLQNPTAIKLQGSTKLTVLTPTGSGTASSTGMQGGSGLGKTMKSSNAVLRTGKLQGGPPTASANPGSSTSMDSITNGPVTYFKVKAVDETTGQITTGSITPGAATSTVQEQVSSNVPISTSGYAELQTAAVAVDQGYVSVRYYVAVTDTSLSSNTFSAYVKNDTTGNILGPSFDTPIPGGAQRNQSAEYIDQNPSVGVTNTYGVYALCTGSANANPIIMIAENVKV